MQEIYSLDERTKQAFNAVKDPPTPKYRFYDFFHAILKKGVDGIFHAQLMKKARAVASGSTSLEAFVEKYQLTVTDNQKLQLPRKSLQLASEEEGIYIPPIVSRSDAPFILCNSGYAMDFIRAGFLKANAEGILSEETPYAYIPNLLNRSWKREDLQEKECVEQGIKFGNDLWKCSVQRYKDMQKMYSSIRGLDRKELAEAQQALLTYYTAIASS